MVKLSNRLLAVASFVTDGNILADIGTDHGYIPIFLVQEKRIPGAIAMDINAGPLERAKEHIDMYGLNWLSRSPPRKPSCRLNCNSNLNSLNSDIWRNSL